jgi:hypothetical protein
VADPYVFVRAVTMSTAAFWTLRGLVRAARFVRRWERRMHPLGLPHAWFRAQVARMLVRATILDPVNVGLMLVLLAIWSLPRN